MIIHGPTAALCDWVAERIPLLGKGSDFGPCLTMGVVRGGDLVAAAVVHDWQPQWGRVQFSFASSTAAWASRRIVAELLAVPFGHLNAWQLWAATPCDNARVRRFARWMGLREEAELRDYFGPGVPAVIMSMTRPEYEARYERAV